MDNGMDVPILREIKTDKSGFPGGPVVKNSPANAGDARLIPAGKIPHAAEQLSWCAITAEPKCSRVCTRNKRSHPREKPIHGN